jgi:hypothetical protein
MAAEADPEIASERRRNVALAIASPLLGAALFGTYNPVILIHAQVLNSPFFPGSHTFSSAGVIHDHITDAKEGMCSDESAMYVDISHV